MSIFSLKQTTMYFLYWLKWAASLIALRLRRRVHRKRFDLYDFETENEPEKVAILVPKEEIILESPFPEEHLQIAADEIFFYGVNSQNQRLVVRVSRAPNDEAEAWVYLKLKDGRWYELQERAGYQRNYGGKCTSFTCGGLQMYYLSAMRRWRIVYCGLLKEGIKKGENEERKEVFVKFTFLWTASSDVFDNSSDVDIRMTADAMASSKWTTAIPPVHKVSEILNFYCQSGVINGVVSIEDEPDVEMYLFGERIRYLGNSSDAVGCKFKHVMGITPASGLVVHLGRASAPNTFHNLHFGFIVHPDTFLRVIEDGIIISRTSGSAESKENLIATFKAGRQYELRGNFLHDGVRLASGRGWNSHLELVETEFEVDGIRGSGFMLSGEVLKLPERKQKILPTLPTAKPLTVYFTDDVSQLTDLTGGKGSSLGVLTKLSSKMKSEFIVPKGIVVTTAAYTEFLIPDLISKIEKLKDITYGNVQGNVQEACKMVTSAFERASLPDKITKQIEEKLSKIFHGNVNGHKVAVRSSATGEDTDQMSAAGQMDTFLGVRGLKEIFIAVKKCWASQFAYIATEYKRQNGQILNSPMAVVIQKMVECEAAGVLFTCDPVTNSPSVTVITGNYGLGESVVSGSEEPDTLVLKKLPMNEVVIQSVTVGLKQHRIVMTDTESTEDENTVVTEDVPEDKRNECCISQEIALRLGKLSLKIEEHFKSPRDIEWGIKDNTIFILQSRPITTSAATSDYEIKHEFDGPLRCEREFFTVCNTGEVMPGASSPLGLDITKKYITSVFSKNAMQRRAYNNFMKHKYFAAGMLSFYNHLVMSVVDLVTGSGDIDSVEAQSLMVGVFGRILDDPELKKQGQYKEVLKKKTDLKSYLSRLLEIFFSGSGLEKLKEEIFTYQIPAKSGKTSIETFDLLMHSCSHFTKPFLTHMICTEMSSLWNMFMLLALGSGGSGRIDTEVYGDFAKLMASSSNVESADIPSAIQKLARKIVKSAKGKDFKSMAVEDALDWLETSTDSAGVEFREFIKRHGHRCLEEFDVYSVPWGMDPKPLIRMIQNMADSFGEAKEKKEDDLSTILPHLTVPMNFKKKLLLRFLLPNCRRGVRERETCKSILIKCMDNMKRGLHHLSRMMVAEGYLPEADLLFFLTTDEIQDLLQSRNPRLISRANHRRKLLPKLKHLFFPDIWKGIPTPINENQDEEVEYVADLTMKGIPVSQGAIKAYARVAMTLEDAVHLKPGEILITYSTDIGWSPYFPILAGIVTELGGLVSHGAVVSREYGLPCVVGIHGATKQFVTGDYVLLDGNKGILQRLTPPEQVQIKI